MKSAINYTCICETRRYKEDIFTFHLVDRLANHLVASHTKMYKKEK